VKVVAGQDRPALERFVAAYGAIIHCAPTIKMAEATEI